MEPGDSKDAAGDVVIIAREIMDYISLNPTASDNLEGIAHWWLSGESRNIVAVQRALEHLITQGRLVEYERPSGQTVYAIKRGV